jgi:selenocysteine lyase/cysteine desulfurase
VSYKHLFSQALSAPRLHFAAHSHHLWPDAALAGHAEAGRDAALLADAKWGRILEEVLPCAQREVASELGLPDPSTIAFSPNTHDLLVRLFSAKERTGPLKVLTSDGEFHSFRRQADRWEEAGTIERHIIACEPYQTFAERFLAAMDQIEPDIAFVSQVMFNSGLRFDDIAALAAHARPEGPWVVIDGYHAFMAIPVDLSGVADRVFYLAGGYKYAMAGEGACFLHCPPGFAPRPVVTGWYAAFGHLEGRVQGVQYSTDGMRMMGATFDASALYRFNAVRTMLEANSITTSVATAHAARLRELLERHLAAGTSGPLREAQLVRPNPRGPEARFVALRDPRAGEWRAALAARDVIVDARDDVLRIGLGLYQDPDDVMRLIQIMATL